MSVFRRSFGAPGPPRLSLDKASISPSLSHRRVSLKWFLSVLSSKESLDVTACLSLALNYKTEPRSVGRSTFFSRHLFCVLFVVRSTLPLVFVCIQMSSCATICMDYRPLVVIPRWPLRMPSCVGADVFKGATFWKTVFVVKQCHRGPQINLFSLSPLAVAKHAVLEMSCDVTKGTCF